MTEEFAVERDKITRAPVHPGVFFERDILPKFLRQRRTIGAPVALLVGVLVFVIAPQADAQSYRRAHHRHSNGGIGQ